MKVYIAEYVYSSWNAIFNEHTGHKAIDSVFLDKNVAERYIEAKEAETGDSLVLTEYEVRDMPL
jgi:hypothetical protein